MKSGLHIKLVLIMLVMIVSLMTVVCAFLVRGVLGFFFGDFYEQMSRVFSIPEFVYDLRQAAAGEEPVERLGDRIGAYSGLLGIDSDVRNYYILDGDTAAVLYGPENAPQIEITPNILTALGGREGYSGRVDDAYMDVALPIEGGGNRFIVYIKDNKRTVKALNMELFKIIVEALVVGLIISLILSFLLSKTMVIPIQSLTRGANRVAAGDFPEKLEVRAKDEIGVLTRTFNEMATRLQETLEDIENEKNKLSTVFLHMTDGITVFSRDGELIHRNPSAEEMLGVELRDSVPGYSGIFGELESWENLQKLTSGDVAEKEWELGGRSLEVSFAPFSGEGAQGGVMAVIHDVTQQKKLESMRKEFVANVSHELRTPITSIRSYAETLLMEDSIDSDTRSEFLNVIVNESDRMTKIVQDLMALSRFDAGAVDMQIERFDLKKSLRNIYNAMILEANKQGLTLTLEETESESEIEGDRSRIEQVIINVVSNALRYTPEGGSVAVRMKEAGKMAVIEVEDTGIGIPKEDIPRLFDRFYRVDKARSRAFGGTGLGLSIAGEIIGKHGGEIVIESECGKGTKVKITVPKERYEPNL